MESKRIRIDTQIPGGNVIVQTIDHNKITLKKDLRNTAGDWFYWMFKAEFFELGVYEFYFQEGPAVGTRGPAVSFDGGLNWSWLKAGSFNIENNSFIYENKLDKPSSVIFCLSMNYLQNNFDNFAARHRGDSNFKIIELCKSRKGRKVELINVKSDATTEKTKVLLTCRHHCCEMTANYVIEGMLEEAMENPEILKFIEFFVVPFVDKDGVEDGDQGKNRKPHDHARDYIEGSIYPETRAIRELILKNKINIVIDLHCPWIYTGTNELIHIVGSESEKNQKEIDQYAAILEKKAAGLIPFSASNIIRFGTSWNTKNNYTQGVNLKTWATHLDFVNMSVTFEIPYANIRDFTIDTNKLRLWGRVMTQALFEYLKKQKINLK